mmetsp:Transcript_9213/g.26941  ORF Transcript_9213/g.26941 Transcript_9213/m.26941 type:complete len:201 (+) Transcript_9213:569-1171(+)
MLSAGSALHLLVKRWLRGLLAAPERFPVHGHGVHVHAHEALLRTAAAHVCRGRLLMLVPHVVEAPAVKRGEEVAKLRLVHAVRVVHRGDSRVPPLQHRRAHRQARPRPEGLVAVVHVAEAARSVQRPGLVRARAGGAKDPLVHRARAPEGAPAIEGPAIVRRPAARRIDADAFCRRERWRRLLQGGARLEERRTVVMLLL